MPGVEGVLNSDLQEQCGIAVRKSELQGLPTGTHMAVTINNPLGAGGVAQWAECLPSLLGALGLILGTA